MATQAPIAVTKSKRSVFSPIATFVLDTLIVYVLALRVSGLLVSHWFAWVAPLLQISVRSPGDWYLQHLEWVTIIPALAAGYINLGSIVPAMLGKLIDEGRSAQMALWAWIVPTLILIYKMLRYHAAPSSVLYGSSMSATSYFFEIQRAMPTRTNLFAVDSVRLMAQTIVTAPFYAGIAYSVGALASKHGLEETRPNDETEQTTPASPSSEPD